jgi:hypothetical protein
VASLQQAATLVRCVRACVRACAIFWSVELLVWGFAPATPETAVGCMVPSIS